METFDPPGRAAVRWRSIVASETLLVIALASFGVMYSGQWAFYSHLGLRPEDVGATYQGTLIHLVLVVMVLSALVYLAAILGSFALVVDYLFFVLLGLFFMLAVGVVFLQYGYLTWVVLVIARVRVLHRDLRRARRVRIRHERSRRLRKTAAGRAAAARRNDRGEGGGALPESIVHGGRGTGSNATRRKSGMSWWALRRAYRSHVTPKMIRPVLSLPLAVFLGAGAAASYSTVWPATAVELPRSAVGRFSIWVALNAVVFVATLAVGGFNWSEIGRRVRAALSWAALVERAASVLGRVLSRSFVLRWVQRTTSATTRRMLAVLCGYLLTVFAMLSIMVNAANSLSTTRTPSFISGLAMDLALVQRPRVAVLTPTDCGIVAPRGTQWGVPLLWLGTSSAGHVVVTPEATVIVSADYASLSLPSGSIPPACGA